MNSLWLKRALIRVPGLRMAWRRTRDATLRHMGRKTADRIGTGRYDVLILFGMRRAGNHLTISWILDQAQGPAVFYNNIDTAMDPDRVPVSEFRLGRPGRRHGLIVLSYEDKHPEEVLAGPLGAWLDERRTGSGGNIRFGVILRDPYNMFSSRMRKWPERFDTTFKIDTQIAMWLDHADLAADPHPVWRDAPVVPLLYNRIVTGQDYRRALSKRLDLRQGDRGLDRIPLYGHGSSFDGIQTPATSLQRDVMSRWQTQKDDPVLKHVAGHPRIAKMAHRLFDLSVELDT